MYAFCNWLSLNAFSDLLMSDEMTNLNFCCLNFWYFNLTCLYHLRRCRGAHTSQTQNGNTALIHAAWSGHSDCVRLLLESGVDKDVKNNVRSMSFLSIQSALQRFYAFLLFGYACRAYLNRIDSKIFNLHNLRMLDIFIMNYWAYLLLLDFRFLILWVRFVKIFPFVSTRTRATFVCWLIS